MKRFISVMAMCCLAASCAGSQPSSTTTMPSSMTTVPVSTTPPSTRVVATTSTTQSPPADVGTVKDVSFSSGDIELVGTLRLPAGENLPGVVLIHGSGPNSRDEVAVGQLNMTFGFEIPIFAEIGEALQAAGFAVLTYDKRTCGQFNGCADNDYPIPDADTVIDDFIGDAEAAVAFLRKQPEVDPSQVSVVGHSQGAEFIPVMLENDPSLAKGAMLAGPYRPIDEMMEYQYDSTVDLLESLGMSEEQALAAPGVAELAASLDDLRAIRNGSDDPAVGVSAAFWRSWFDLAEARVEAVAVLTQPVLIVGGSYDWNVPVDEAEAWDALFSAEDKEHSTVILDCVTHALNCVSEPDIASISLGDIGDHVAGEVTAVLIGFLNE